MPPLTHVPPKVAYFLRGTQHLFHYRHHLIFCWTLVLILVYQDKATLTGLARFGPKHICEWHLRRFLYAGYWCWRVLLSRLVDSVLAVLPPPEDGVVYVIGDGTYKDKTAKKHPLVKKGRLTSYGPYLFGLQIVLLMIGWGNYRIPVDMEIVRPKGHLDHHSPNALFRQMLRRFQPPRWAKRVIVLADAEFPSKETLKLIQERKFFFVMSLARTWKFEDGHSLKDLVTHIRKDCFTKTWFINSQARRRVYWAYLKKTRLRHIGDVTVVLSKKRRNSGPKATKILVTNLPEVNRRTVIALYSRRWNVELLIKELKGATGMGQAQVTKEPRRVERSVALSLMAYLMLLRFRHTDIPAQGAWSAFTLKRNFAWEIMQQQIEHTCDLRLKKQRLFNKVA